MTNTDQRLTSYRDRAIRLETEKRNLAEDLKELWKEAKGNGVSKDEIAGAKLSVKRHFEDDEKRAKRVTAEEVAASLGEFASSPLGGAAVRAAA